jgi:hypothetical protein
MPLQIGSLVGFLPVSSISLGAEGARRRLNHASEMKEAKGGTFGQHAYDS